MNKNRVYHKKKTVIVFFSCLFLLTGLIVRMVYLMVIESDYYAKKAQTLHERERDIKAERGKIIDAKGEVLADNTELSDETGLCESECTNETC